MSPHVDRQGRLTILVERMNGLVKHIPLLVSKGLVPITIGEKEFDRLYAPQEDYPIDQAVRLFIRYARDIGANREALQIFERVQKLDIADRTEALLKYGRLNEPKTERGS